MEQSKNSLKGLIRVEEENGKYVAYDLQDGIQEAVLNPSLWTENL